MREEVNMKCPGCGSTNVENAKCKAETNNWDRHCRDCDLLFNLERPFVTLQVYRNNQKAERISTSLTEEHLNLVKATMDTPLDDDRVRDILNEATRNLYQIRVN